MEKQRVLRGLLDRHKSELENLAAGLARDPLTRCMAVADFLNKFVEAFTNEHQNLYKLRRGGDLNGFVPDGDLLGTVTELRTARSHYRRDTRSNWRADLLKMAGVRSVGEAADRLRQLSEALASATRVAPLTAVVECLLG